MEHALVGFATILVVGIGTQWLAWRVRVPSIFLLLLAGFVVGRATGWVDPDHLLGEALFPVVSLSVAIILFEGGLSLDIAELRTIGAVVRRLITAGTLVTWVLTAWLAQQLLGFDLGLSVLLGAIMVVTGPTVIIPLLRQIRPSVQLASTIRWEGIVNDPIGAILAVLVFDALLAGGLELHARDAFSGVVKATLAGGGLGLLGAGVLVLLLDRYWVPDFLQSPVTLAMVVVVFTLSDLILVDSGLLAVTVMGSAVASQKRVPVRPIVQFKENLRVVLISALFVILAARLPVDDPLYTDPGALLFVAGLIFIVRPATVAVATIGSVLSWRERILLAWMAPRGIVAAAVASVLGLQLVDAGYPGAERFASIVFMVIIATVALYGLTAGPLARWLGVATSTRRGLLIAGAGAWVRALGSALQKLKIDVLLVDSNWNNIAAARQAGLRAHYGNILAEHIEDELDLERIGRLLALTPNDEVNTLAILHLREVFDGANVYQLAPERPQPGRRQGRLPKDLRGRHLFAADVTWSELSRRFAEGAVFKSTKLTDEFDYAAFKERYGDEALPLMTLSPSGQLQVLTSNRPVTPVVGTTILSLAREVASPTPA